MNSTLITRLLSSLLIAMLLIAHPSTAVSSEVTEKKLSLANCIEIALGNATSAKKGAYNIKLQGVDVLRSYGRFLPRLSLSAAYTPYTLGNSYSSSYNYTNTLKIKTESRSVNLGLSTSLNLFNGFSDYASLQAALNREQAARYSMEQAVQTITFDVTQAYYQVLLSSELLEIARENLLSSQDQLRLTDRQFQIGLKSITDHYQQEADTAESRATVIKAEARMQKSTLELLRRLQIDPKTSITLEPAPDELKTLPSLKPDIESLISVALERRNDLKSKALETKATKWQITESRSTRYPTLDLSVNASTGGTDYLRQSINGGSTTQYPYPPLSEQLGNSIGYSVALNLSWALFDRFQSRYNVEAAKINHLNQQLDYEDLKQNIVIDLREAANEYTSAFMQIETAKVSLKAANSAFEGIKRKYELGAAGFVELSTARAALFNARSNLSQATYNLALQKSVLDFTTGNLPVQ